jgi:hypothetical protein
MGLTGIENKAKTGFVNSVCGAYNDVIASSGIVRNSYCHRSATYPAVDRQQKSKGCSVLTTRPKVAELTFQLYSRPLHPELFQIHRTQDFRRGGYQVKIDITSAGHVVTLRYGAVTLTEVATSAHNPLPKMRRLMVHPLKGERSDSLHCRGNIHYQTEFQLETASPDLFWAFQQELAEDTDRWGILHTFHASGRLALGAVSYMHVETRERSVLVQAFHTFPDDWAIVKSQSLFEMPEPTRRR